MLTSHHKQILASADPDTRLEARLALRGFRRMSSSHADVVLSLLRAGTPRTVRLAEALVGRPIQRLPPAVALARRPVAAVADRRGDDRLVTRWRRGEKPSGRPMLLVCPIYERLSRIRVGMSVAQLLARGVRRKDIRTATRRGWLEIER